MLVVEDIGYADGGLSSELAKALIRHVDLPKIRYAGVEANSKNTSSAQRALESAGIPADNIALRTGWFGETNSGINKFGKAHIVLASHLYSAGFLDKLKSTTEAHSSCLDNFMQEDSLFIAVHNWNSDIAKIKSNFPNILVQEDDYTEKLSMIHAKEQRETLHFDFSYQMNVPRVSEAGWQALKSVPTAHYHWDYSALGQDFKEFYNLINFLMVGPIESISQSQRAELLTSLQSQLERCNYKLNYTVRVQVTMHPECRPEFAAGVKQAIKNMNTSSLLSQFSLLSGSRNEGGTSREEKNEAMASLI